MEFFKTRSNIDFLGNTRLMVAISVVACALCLGSIVVRGFNFGIDFVGGTVIEVKAPEGLGEVDEQRMRVALADSAHPDASVVRFGAAADRTFRITVRTSQDEQRDLSIELVKAMSAQVGGELEMRSVDSIGPRVGDELRRSALTALLLSWVGMLLYIWFRFEWQYAPGAVVALLHDVTITAGMFSIFGWEFDLNVFAALLVIIGYSINDTIVIYDRIRETVALRGTSELEDVVNQSLNATLSRTILTSGVTLLVVISILILGGPVLYGLALALLIGMLSGTYSTIYVASALFIWLARRYRKAAASGAGRARRAEV